MPLRKVLATPFQIASDFDWRKVCGATILTLDIHKDRIGMAIACHPSYGDKVSTLDSIPIAKKSKRGKGKGSIDVDIDIDSDIDTAVLSHLDKITQDYKVCSVVVSWPLQKDTGRKGAACGHTLHTIENLLKRQQQEQQQNLTSILTPKRPVCFWNSSSHAVLETTDPWGRCPSYATPDECYTTTAATKVVAVDQQQQQQQELSPPPRTGIHVASKEQYHQNEHLVAATVWDDFCRVHWPVLHAQNQQSARQAKPKVPRHAAFLVQDRSSTTTTTTTTTKSVNTTSRVGGETRATTGEEFNCVASYS
jgi:RNase H-fold protein (predicted Holliday junction resolvase)